jgi:hypothetical protein
MRVPMMANRFGIMEVASISMLDGFNKVGTIERKAAELICGSREAWAVTNVRVVIEPGAIVAFARVSG